MAIQINGQNIKTGGPGPAFPQDQQGALLATELNPRYYEQAYLGQTFFTSTAAAAGTAFVGAAGGTPLLAVWNPAGSGKNLVLLQAMVGVVATATGAGTTQFRLYGGATAAITQATVATPVSCLSLAASGSVAKAYANVATTSSTALTYITTIGNYYWATAAGAILTEPLIQDFSGAIIVAPGNMVAIGAVTILTSMTNDAYLLWSELPI
jgi:hypothetical protein